MLLGTLNSVLVVSAYYLLLPGLTAIAFVLWFRSRSVASLIMLAGLVIATAGWAVPFVVSPEYYSPEDGQDFTLMELVASILLTAGSLIFLVGFGTLAGTSPTKRSAFR